MSTKVMNSIRTTIYDWMAYLIPGAVTVWALWELLHTKISGAEELVVNRLPVVAQLILLLIVCYILGHLLHALANFTIDRLPSGGYPPRNYFPEKFREHFPRTLREALWCAVLRKAKIPADKKAMYDESIIKDAYWLCYVSVTDSHPESLVQLFLSISGFYRGMCISCFLVGVVYLLSSLIYVRLIVAVMGVVSSLIGLIFLFRIRRFKEYLTKTVYMSFLCLGEYANFAPNKGAGEGIS
jgi:hypothetical protein